MADQPSRANLGYGPGATWIATGGRSPIPSGSHAGAWPPPQPQPGAWPPPPHSYPAPGPPGAGRSRFPLSPALLVGLCAAVAAAVFELSYSSSQTVNGVVTDCSYLNVSPLIFGPVGAFAGLVALVRGGRGGRSASLERGLGLMCVVLGVVHVLGALDMLGGVSTTLAGNPC